MRVKVREGEKRAGAQCFSLKQVSGSWNTERRHVGEKCMPGAELPGGPWESSFALIASALARPPTGALVTGPSGAAIPQLVRLVSVLTLLLETLGKIFLKPTILKPDFQQLQ